MGNLGKIFYLYKIFANSRNFLRFLLGKINSFLVFYTPVNFQNFFSNPDMRIVAGTAGTPEEPPKKNTLKIKILFASQWGAWGTVRHYSHVWLAQARRNKIESRSIYNKAVRKCEIGWKCMYFYTHKNKIVIERNKK